MCLDKCGRGGFPIICLSFWKAFSHSKIHPKFFPFLIAENISFQLYENLEMINFYLKFPINVFVHVPLWYPLQIIQLLVRIYTKIHITIAIYEIKIDF